MFAAGNGSLHMPAVERTLKRQSLRMPIRSPASFFFPREGKVWCCQQTPHKKILYPLSFTGKELEVPVTMKEIECVEARLTKGGYCQLCNKECWQGKDGQRCQHLNSHGHMQKVKEVALEDRLFGVSDHGRRFSEGCAVYTQKAWPKNASWTCAKLPFRYHLIWGAHWLSSLSSMSFLNTIKQAKSKSKYSWIHLFCLSVW